MLETLDALLAQPLLLTAILAVGALCGIGVERLVERQKRAERRAYWSGRKHGKTGAAWRGQVVALPLKGSPERVVHDAAEQLRCVMEADFRSRPLLNKPERRLLAVLDQALAQHSPGWRAMGQVSMGEILASSDAAAFSAVNSKRIDLLIVDADCRPMHAIEFQGTGHHLSRNTAARDAVKREALRQAGIGYVEVASGDTPAEVHAIVRKLASRQTAEGGQSSLRMSSASRATGKPNFRTVSTL